MDKHLKKNGGGEITRRFAEEWIKRESKVVKTSAPLPPPMNKVLHIDPVAFTNWMRDVKEMAKERMEYEFHACPDYIQKEFLQYLKSNF